MSNNLYDILGKLNSIEQAAQAPAEQPKAKTKLAESMETVEGKLHEKYMGFKKVAAAAKAGGAKDPEAVAASIGREKYGKKKFQQAAAAGKKLGEGKVKELMMTDLEELTDEEFEVKYHMTKDQAREGLGEGQSTPYEVYYKDTKTGRIEKMETKLTDAKSAKAAWEDWNSDIPGRFVFVKAMPKATKMSEGEKVKVPGGTVHKGTYGSEVDVNADGEQVKKVKGTGQRGRPRKDSGDIKPDWSAFGVTGKKVDLPKWKGARKIKGAGNVDEVAPPGAKAERMVKHIKQSYAKDGKLTPKEKAIAYATAWKAHKAGKVEEAAAAIKTLTDSGMTVQQITEGWSHIVKAAKYTKKTVLESYVDAYDRSLSTEGVVSSVVDMVKQGAKKVADVVAPDDEALMKDLAQKAGVTAKELQKTNPGDADNFVKGGKQLGIFKEETCSECGMAECACPAADEQEGTMNVSVNVDTNGTKSMSVNATGDEAAKLAEILKLAGLGGEPQQVYSPVEVVGNENDEAEEAVEEELANEPDEEVFGTDVQLKGGNGEVAGQEKPMHKDGAARFSDNPLAMRESVYKEYEGIKIKK